MPFCCIRGYVYLIAAVFQLLAFNLVPPPYCVYNVAFFRLWQRLLFFLFIWDFFAICEPPST